MSSNITDVKRKGKVVPSRYRLEKTVNRPGSSADGNFSVLSKTLRTGSEIGKSSTPEKIGAPCQLPSLDASAIKGKLFVRPKSKISDSSTLHKTCVFERKPHHNSTTSQVKVKDKFEVEILYARYLQSKLLESESKLSLKDKNKDIIEIFQEVCISYYQLLEKISEKSFQLSTFYCFNELKNHILKQENMLRPFLEVIRDTSFKEQYTEISSAVNLTRSTIELKSITYSDSDNEEIIHLLKTFIKKYESIVNCIKEPSEIVFCAENMRKYIHQTKNEILEVKEILRSIDKTSYLLIDNTSSKFSAL